MRVRLEWGAAGAAALAGGCDALVVLDVLSFCTAVSVAVDRGTVVVPSAPGIAAPDGATVVAGPRGALHSLSPAALRTAPVVPRLVLPSPNGSAITAAVPPGPAVVAACLRNASAVAEHLSASYDVVGLVPAGERWPGGRLRPAVEDLLGAGAVAAVLDAELDPFAAAALAAWWDARTTLLARLLDCPSGRELVARGYRDDVAIAAELDGSATVPVLGTGGFTAG